MPEVSQSQPNTANTANPDKTPTRPSRAPMAKTIREFVIGMQFPSVSERHHNPYIELSGFVCAMLQFCNGIAPGSVVSVAVSINQLAEVLHCTSRQVKRLAKELVREGFLKPRKPGQRSTAYTLTQIPFQFEPQVEHNPDDMKGTECVPLEEEPKGTDLEPKGTDDSFERDRLESERDRRDARKGQTDARKGHTVSYSGSCLDTSSGVTPLDTPSGSCLSPSTGPSDFGSLSDGPTDNGVGYSKPVPRSLPVWWTDEMTAAQLTTDGLYPHERFVKTLNGWRVIMDEPQDAQEVVRG